MIDDVLRIVNLLAGIIWTGGLVAVAVATRAARSTLGERDQIEFLRAFGRLYGVVAGSALLLFAISGIALAGAPGGWSGSEVTLAVLTVLVAALTAVGVRNARLVGRLRTAALADDADDAGLRSAARAAGVLRAAIAVVTLIAVVVAVT